MPTRCQPQDLSWFYQRVAVFLFFLADVFNLTEQESNQGLSWQFPPTGTAGSNQKRTRSSSKWTQMYECWNPGCPISQFVAWRPSTWHGRLLLQRRWHEKGPNLHHHLWGNSPWLGVAELLADQGRLAGSLLHFPTCTSHLCLPRQLRTKVSSCVVYREEIWLSAFSQ